MPWFRLARIAVTLLIALAAAASSAFAGGAWIVVHAASTPGGPLRLEPTSCNSSAAYSVRAEAELLVNGSRRTIVLEPVATEPSGWLAVQPPVAAQGRWVLRVRPASGPGATTVVAVSAQGRLGESRLIWNSDGRKEATALLAAR